MGSLTGASPDAVDRYRVEGMTCGTCVARVKTALLRVPGVTRASVDILSGTAEVRRDPSLATSQDLSRALAEAGYVLLPLQTESPKVPARAGDDYRPFALGALGTAGLLGLYLGIGALAQGWEHAIALLAGDLPFVAAIAAGFGVQVGLLVHLRRLHAHASAKSVAASGATGTATMLACCAHHLVDVAPVVGLAGLATLLGAYRVPLLWVGLAANLAGIAYVLRQVRRVRGATMGAQAHRAMTAARGVTTRQGAT